MTKTPDSVQIRARLVEALELDLIGPGADHPLAEESLSGRQRPSNWYLTGFLVPADARSKDRSDDDDHLEEIGETPADAGLGEESTEEGTAKKKSLFPSSMGLSFFVPPEAERLEVTVRWGDYSRRPFPPEDGRKTEVWRRSPREEVMSLTLGTETVTHRVPDSGGLVLHLLERRLDDTTTGLTIARGTRAISLFLVNRRPAPKEKSDTAYAFQSKIEVRCSSPFVPRSDPPSAGVDEQEGRIADLRYRDTPEYAVGHGVAADWEKEDGSCRCVWTTWLGRAEVERTDADDDHGVELSLRALGALEDRNHAEASLRPLVRKYREWIESQRRKSRDIEGAEHQETAREMLGQAETAAKRMERGIALLETDEDALDAFRVANRSVERALRQRLGEPSDGHPMRWRAFQLAFLLLNLPGLIDPTDPHREFVDLLFFPTGGGKTEAYLGLAAFAMVLRRLRHPGTGGREGAGVSVIMRYTLRLLTLDQLSRASGLVCALELEREQNPKRYGEWRFEIGLWVGKAATPNLLGRSGDGRSDTARARLQQFKSDSAHRPPPIPLPLCPWCGTDFDADSFHLHPEHNEPTELRICCVNLDCDFSGDRALPILAVDEPIYRRLPAFLVATVDKFAALPWFGSSGVLLGGASRYDDEGFYGASEPRIGQALPNAVPPPDLVIQDELHLISGPLGTMMGLYETSIAALCEDHGRDTPIRPKIVASTATAGGVRDQVQAVFGRPITMMFPPPGPDRRDSFFARTRPPVEVPARLYLGLTSPGRNPKALMRRVAVALMGAAQSAWNECGGRTNPDNPAEPYMTLLSYFISLRELGGARRILEEEVQNTLRGIGGRGRVGERRGFFRDRKRFSEVLELTSRVSTDRVAKARARLGVKFRENQSVDCAIATNMISVGLDIPRLGLMLVLGQPKAHAEYIQTTSRVGRDARWPGLVVTLLNIHKPRDRSHYERFRHYHDTFYRSVEPASVTPFAARALDRGFAGAMVALARHTSKPLTPAAGAARIRDVREPLEARLREVFAERVREQPLMESETAERRDQTRRVQDRVGELVEAWGQIVQTNADAGVGTHYQRYEGSKVPQYLLRDVLETVDDPDEAKFRVHRSLRDVEPAVNVVLQDLGVRPAKTVP